MSRWPKGPGGAARALRAAIPGRAASRAGSVATAANVSSAPANVAIQRARLIGCPTSLSPAGAGEKPG